MEQNGLPLSTQGLSLDTASVDTTAAIPVGSLEAASPTDSATATHPQEFVIVTKRHIPWLLWGIAGMVACLVLGGFIFFTQKSRNTQQSLLSSGHFDTVSLPLKDLRISSPSTYANASHQLQVNGQLQVADSLILSPGSTPINPVSGQIYFDKSTATISYYNGKQFIPAGGTTINQSSTTTINNITNTSGGGGSYVALQPAASTSQTGSFNVSGTGQAGALKTAVITTPNGTLNVQDASGASWLGVNTSNGTITASTVSIGHITGGSVDSLFDDVAVADRISIDANPVNLGIRFKSDRAGYITGIKFYNPAGNNAGGTDIGQLWACNDAACTPGSGGTPLASVTFGADTAQGWKQATFSSPVAINPNTYYVASYYSKQAMYYYNNRYFMSALDNSPLYAPAGISVGTSRFIYGSTGFPTGTFEQANYWVDVMFSPTDTVDNITSTNSLTISTSGNKLTLGQSAKDTTIQGSTVTILSSGDAVWGVGMSASGAGGNLMIQAGRGFSGANTNGGSLYLQGGEAGGSGTGGQVIVRSLTDGGGAFQIQSSTSQELFGADTSAMEIAVVGADTKYASLALINTRFVSVQGNPPTMATPSNCGIAPTATVTSKSTDIAGSFVITTGTGGTSSTCDSVFSFNDPTGSIPKSIIVVGKTDAASAARQVYVSAVSATSFTVSFGVSAGGANNTAYSFSYWVIE